MFVDTDAELIVIGFQVTQKALSITSIHCRMTFTCAFKPIGWKNRALVLDFKMLLAFLQETNHSDAANVSLE